MNDSFENLCYPYPGYYSITNRALYIAVIDRGSYYEITSLIMEKNPKIRTKQVDKKNISVIKKLHDHFKVK